MHLPHAPADLAAIACAYLLGAIPFGLLLVRLTKGIDVRSVGSGNIGATNAMRAGGRGLGLAVFALDFLKGWIAASFVPPWIGSAGGSAFDALRVACGVAAVVGHCFPIYLRFKGGKGVATACGVVVALDPVVFLWGGAAWIAVVALTRFVGLASMGMVATFLAAAWILRADERPELAQGAGILLALICYRHRSNISRMLAGTEPKLFSGSKRAPPGGPQ
jgi:acyl phosphate:glycerol-3-phosphate acyltransferase